MASNKRDLTTLMTRTNEPWLIFIHGKKENEQTFYSFSEKKYHVKSIPLMRKTDICTASHGWMVLHSDNLHCFLFNPITTEKIQLPESDFSYRVCVLTSSPDDPKCVVVFVSCLEKGVFVFRFCNPRGKVDHWIENDMKFDDQTMILGAVSMNGKVYTCMDNGRVFDVFIIEAIDNNMTVKKMGIEIRFPIPDHPLFSYRSVVESCGELYTVRMLYEGFYTFHEIAGFEIFKLDSEKKCWERVKSIGKRAFYFGYRTSCSAPAEDFECGIIYMTRYEDRSLYAYNVKEKSISISLPCPNVQNNWSQPYCFLPSSSDKIEEKIVD